MRVDADAVLELLPDVVIVMESDGTVAYVNAAVTRILGWPTDDVVGRSGFAFVHPDEQAEAVAAMAEQVEIGSAATRHHVELLRRDGGFTKFELLSAHMPGDTDRFVLVLRDISDREATQKQLHRSDAQLRALTENVPDALGRFDDSCELVFATRRFEEVVRADDTLLERWTATAKEVLVSGSLVEVEQSLADHSGWIETRFVPELGPDGEVTHVLVIATDVTDRKENELHLIRAATHDPLTGLLNRRRLCEVAERALLRSSGAGEQVALIFVDLDRFKSVNDDHGHNAGDAVLADIARRLSEVVRPNDVVARFGGDEFVVFCPDLAAEPARSVVARIQEVLSAPLTSPDGTVTYAVGASIGLAVGTPGETTFDVLLEDADRSMYRAKAERR